MVELGRTSRGGVDHEVGTVGAFAYEDEVWITVGVEGHLQAGLGFFAVVLVGEVDVDHDGTGENWLVEQGTDDGASAWIDGEVFTFDGLGAVVWVERPSVLPGELLGSVLAHDLRTGDGLAFVDGVPIPDVEDQAGRGGHGLYADEIVCDESRVGLADHRQGESGEVGDVAGGCGFFEDGASFVGIPCVVLVFEHGRDEAVFLGLDFDALFEDWGPFVDKLVALTFEEQPLLSICFLLLGEDTAA